MTPPSQHPGLSGFLTTAMPVLASVAGAVLSLAFVEKLNLRGKCVAVGVGFTTAVILGDPAASVVAHALPWLQPVQPGVHFLIALSAMSALPPLLKWVASFASNPVLGVMSPLAETLLRLKGDGKAKEAKAP